MDTFVEWGPWYTVYIIAVDTSWPHAGAIIRVWVSRTKKRKSTTQPTNDRLLICQNSAGIAIPI